MSTVNLLSQSPFLRGLIKSSLLFLLAFTFVFADPASAQVIQPYWTWDATEFPNPFSNSLGQSLAGGVDLNFNGTFDIVRPYYVAPVVNS